MACAASLDGHTLTGVWIETSMRRSNPSRRRVTPSRVCGLKRVDPFRVASGELGHTLTGVWIETSRGWMNEKPLPGHTLTGVWIETTPWSFTATCCCVTPSRVCGLKLEVRHASTPAVTGHTLTGVWIETR